MRQICLFLASVAPAPRLTALRNGIAPAVVLFPLLYVCSLGVVYGQDKGFSGDRAVRKTDYWPIITS